jgi:hypothetical protein
LPFSCAGKDVFRNWHPIIHISSFLLFNCVRMDVCNGLTSFLESVILANDWVQTELPWIHVIISLIGVRTNLNT